MALPSDEELARARALWASGAGPPLQVAKLSTHVESEKHEVGHMSADQTSSTPGEMSRKTRNAISGPDVKPMHGAVDASGERSPQDIRAGEAILREITKSMEDLGAWRKQHGEGVVMVPSSPFTLRLILLLMEGLHHGFKVRSRI
jgi:hypothetical protein